MPGQILRPTGLLRTEDDYRESPFRPKSTALRRKRHRLTPYRVHQAETAPFEGSLAGAYGLRVNDPSFAPDLLVKELGEIALFEQVSELSAEQD